MSERNLKTVKFGMVVSGNLSSVLFANILFSYLILILWKLMSFKCLVSGLPFATSDYADIIMQIN